MLLKMKEGMLKNGRYLPKNGTALLETECTDSYLVSDSALEGALQIHCQIFGSAVQVDSASRF
jgi:hypothetical protein